jgi:hypothetical protein
MLLISKALTWKINKPKNSFDTLRSDDSNTENRDYAFNASKRGRKHNGSFDFRWNEHFKKSENDQEWSVQVGTRPNQGDPIR